MKTINFKALIILLSGIVMSCSNKRGDIAGHEFNSYYTGDNIDRIAFPVGGIGTGMFCIEGTGAISHMSVRNRPDLLNEPFMFAAISVKGLENGTKVLEGPVPEWKKFCRGGRVGRRGANYGFPRFENVKFSARFPFCEIVLNDSDIPLAIDISGWSPFIPTDADNSSLPVGAIEYTFKNTGNEDVEAMFSYNSKNFMVPYRKEGSIKPIRNGFLLSYTGDEERRFESGDYAIYTDDDKTTVDYCWFRGWHFDDVTTAWETIKKAEAKYRPPVEKGARGASLFVPVNLKPGESKTVRLMMAWYVPDSNVRYGEDPEDNITNSIAKKQSFSGACYKPWYSAKFNNIAEVVNYWSANYSDLYMKSELFKQAFYNSTLPPEVIEAVAANLTILKSPTVLRQTDGRLWAFEGSGDTKGSCPGSCTHVWNYAQAVSHLFPSLERSLRETEFYENQNSEGHQTFRAALPIRPVAHDFYAAADGQLGEIMKVYREWRISGDNQWLKTIYPKVKLSIDYCISTWDPRHKGVLEEPQHNTYDVEFWGQNNMCSIIYLNALNAFIKIGKFMQDDVSFYLDLFTKGKAYLEQELFNGEYFIQKVMCEELNSPGPEAMLKTVWSKEYSEEEKALFEKEGPKYQYGEGCLSDGVIGSWMSLVCGLNDPMDVKKIKSHLNSVYQYNLIHDLADHENPQRPTYALGKEGGLIICTWPRGGKPSLPFVYSSEVWTGIEYQVASHLIFMDEVEKGLDIVRTCRQRYDGRVRNPFDEHEAGHWYARAMSSYSLIQALTGMRYDAVDRILYIDSRIGDFIGFLSTETGFGNVGLKNGEPFIDIVYGNINVEKIMVSGIEKRL